MNLLVSCVGKRGGYVADCFRPHLEPGDRIIGTANTSWTPGFAHCDVARVLPSVDEDDYVPAVLDLCERERVSAVVCVEDFDLEALLPARPTLLERGVVPLFPPAEVAEVALDKYRTHKFLTAEGVRTPRTALSPAEAADFRFPVYVKPRRGSGSQQVFRARNDAELAVFYDYAPDMIVQEEAVGQEINIQLCGDLDGRPVGICLLRKRAMRHGETDQAETFWDPDVVGLGLRLGELLGSAGPVDIDVIDSAEGLVVLEANTRFGGGYPVSHLAGADFPALLCDLARGRPVTRPVCDYEPGVVMMKDVRVLGGKAGSFFRDTLHLRQGS